MQKRILSVLLALTLTAGLVGCGAAEQENANIPGAVNITLTDEEITADGKAVNEDETAAVYTAHDIIYYQAGQDFTYGEGSEEDAHTAEEADAHTVVHITQPGTYAVRGTLSAGQIAVDLGEDAKEDPAAVVTLILNGADITCTVAPAIIFYRVYECGETDGGKACETVDTSAAGANLILADGSSNTVRGAYVAKIYKSVTLSKDGTKVVDSKKLHKYDGAVYSRMSLNVDGGEEGTGVLNIIAQNEGLDSELHLTVNGGTLNITSGDDGINTNEDGVSVTTVNGGTLTVCVTGEKAGEGDGIDSNGYLVINGGTVIAAACGSSQDSGIDSDCGIYLNGGTVVASGNMLDAISGSEQNYAVFRFARKQSGGTVYTLKNADGEEVGTYTPANDFSVLIVSAPELTEGEYTFCCGDRQLAHGGEDDHGGPGGMPSAEGVEFPDGERPELPDGEQPNPGTDPGRELPAGFPGDPSERSSSFSFKQGGSFFSSVAVTE